MNNGVYEKKPMAYRFATEADVALILQFIRELADYEQMLPEVVATEELLREWIFEKQKAEVIFSLEAGTEVGFALFFHNFSRPLCETGIPGPRLWQRSSETTGQNCCRPWLRPAGMVVPGLEQAQHRFLPVTGGRAHGRLDRIPHCRQNPDRSGKIRSTYENL